jgi:type IV pilus assembly protein PilW
MTSADRNRGGAYRQNGLSLIELMVAMIIGIFLMLGAVTVYNQSRNTYRASEALARLQEVGRLAMDVVETDLRMANYWGMNADATFIINRAGPSEPQPSAFTNGQWAIVSACGGAGSNWAIDLDKYLDGSNNSYGLSCSAPSGYTPIATSDVLIIRRASDVIPTTLDTNRVYVQSSRIQGELFVPSCASPTNASCIPPGFLPPVSQSRLLEASAYYVTNRSTLRTDVPALRRKRLSNINDASNGYTDDEIVSGIEDMQIRFGIDTNGDTNVDSYVNPGAVGGADVISATIWLRVRSEDRDFSHTDGRSYQYADMASAFTPNDNYRRIVISKTILLRNTRV